MRGGKHGCGEGGVVWKPMNSRDPTGDMARQDCRGAGVTQRRTRPGHGGAPWRAGELVVLSFLVFPPTVRVGVMEPFAGRT